MTTINDGPQPEQAAALAAKKAAAMAAIKAFEGWTLTRLARLAITAATTFAAGLGLAGYHISVPFLATWLLSWLGMEVIPLLTALISSAHLAIRKQVVVPVANYDQTASVNELLAAVMGGLTETPGSDHEGMFL